MDSNRRIKVLLVDDDVRLLKSAARLFRKQFNFFTAEGAEDALQVLKNEGAFEVVVSDQNMPNVNGAEFLSQVASSNPDTIRIMLTGNTDQQTAIEAVNKGQVFRFINKPCPPTALAKEIEAAGKAHFRLIQKRQLLQQTLSGSVSVLLEMLALKRPEAHARSKVLKRWVEKISRHVGLEVNSQNSLAVTLSALSYATLPDELATAYFSNQPLSDEQSIEVAEGFQHAADIVENIPKMETIAQVIACCQLGYDGSGLPENGPVGSNIPLLARVLRVLLDLAEISADGQKTLAQCIQKLSGNADCYDPKVLRVLELALADDKIFALPEGLRSVSVAPVEIQVGDLLAEDLLDHTGKCLLTERFMMNERAITLLISSEKLQHISGLIKVYRP